MPDYFSHYICAQKIYDRLKLSDKQAICDNCLYLLGAQGGDVFFAYKLNFYSSNLGRRMHALCADDLLGALREVNLSYAAGFATHYALDCTLHPAIYAYERGSKSPMAHMNFEKDLGLFISRKFSSPRRILPREKVLGATFLLYDCAKRVEPKVTVTGVERCLKRHFAYTRALATAKKQRYVCDYDFASLSGAVDDAVDFGAECVSCVVAGNISQEKFCRSFLEK